MAQFLFSLIALALAAAIGAVFGGIYDDKFHPHAWLGPCAISKRLGHAADIANPQFPDDLRWKVIDGDTLECEGRPVTVVGYDAPETRKSGIGGAHCDAEVVLGVRAEERVRDLLSRTSWSASTDGVPRDPSSTGRFRIRIYVDNQDLRDILISEGLAKAWDGTGATPDWCAAPSFDGTAN